MLSRVIRGLDLCSLDLRWPAPSIPCVPSSSLGCYRCFGLNVIDQKVREGACQYRKVTETHSATRSGSEATHKGTYILLH